MHGLFRETYNMYKKIYLMEKNILNGKIVIEIYPTF